MKQKHLKTRHYSNKYGMRFAPKIKELVLDESDMVISKNFINKHNKPSFKYYIFNDDQEYFDYIEEHKNTDLFEDIRDDIPKVYFDIDLEDRHKAEGLYRHEVEFMVKEIIRLFNLYFNV